MENNYRSLVTRYGVYLGVLLTLITVLVYAFSLELFTKWWLGIILFAIILVFGIIAVRNAKKIIPGFMSFKQAFTAYFIPVAIGTFISTLATVILFNFVDPDAAETINEHTMEMAEEMMVKFGAPQESIDQEIAKMEGKNPWSLQNTLTSYIFQLAFYAFVGLIVALIFREKDPNQA